MISRRCFVMVALGALCALSSGGCGRSEDVLLFSRDQAEREARNFQRLWAANNLEGLLQRCRLPFTFSGRTWDTAKELRVNLEKQMPRHRERVAGGDEYEILSYRDLLAGLWPRGRDVPEEHREAEIERMGVLPDGYLVRIHHPPQAGFLVVLNSDDGTSLKVQAFWP